MHGRWEELDMLYYILNQIYINKKKYANDIIDVVLKLNKF